MIAVAARRGPGRPASGQGRKIGLYLSQERLEKLGEHPAAAIYALIDAAPYPDGCVQVNIRLTPAQLAKLGAVDEKTARNILMKKCSKRRKK